MNWFKRKTNKKELDFSNKKEQYNNRRNIDMRAVRLDYNENDGGMLVYNEYELYLYVKLDNITDELIKYIHTYTNLKEYIVNFNDGFISVFKSIGKQQGEPVEFGNRFNNGKW